MGILPVLLLLAGKMPAPQEILGYFFNWKSLKKTKIAQSFFTIASCLLPLASYLLPIASCLLPIASCLAVTTIFSLV
jgi:hypothetical protein